jgi:hypothetical protein
MLPFDIVLWVRYSTQLSRVPGAWERRGGSTYVECKGSGRIAYCIYWRWTRDVRYEATAMGIGYGEDATCEVVDVVLRWAPKLSQQLPPQSYLKVVRDTHHREI